MGYKTFICLIFLLSIIVAQIEQQGDPMPLVPDTNLAEHYKRQKHHGKVKQNHGFAHAHQAKLKLGKDYFHHHESHINLYEWNSFAPSDQKKKEDSEDLEILNTIIKKK